MIEIEVQKAYCGDCIWIRCCGVEIINIIIDAGPVQFSIEFQQLVNKISSRGERINLFIFTHIDDDHIRGCMRHIRDAKENIIDKVWINGVGARIYFSKQEHSAKNVHTLIDLLKLKNITLEQPIFEGKQYLFPNGKINVIGPKEKEIISVAKLIDKKNKIVEHSGVNYLKNIDDIEDIYHADGSITNKASIIFVIEFDKKKLLFTGDNTAENILKAVSQYYEDDEFDIIKLPHHGSPRNISSELIQKLHSDKFIISTNKPVDKVVLKRFIERRKRTDLFINYNWWSKSYFTEEDIQKYIITHRLTLNDIGEKKIVL